MYTFVNQGIPGYKKALQDYQKNYGSLTAGPDEPKNEKKDKLREELQDSTALYLAQEVAKATIKGMEAALGLNESEIANYKVECGVLI